MRMALKELMEKLGVNRVLQPYETQPWLHYDAGQGITCSAEVRMGPGGDDVETEIQFLKDETEDQDSGETATGNGTEQIMRMRIEPVASNEWTTKSLRVKGEDFANKIYNWEEKGCDFFRAVIEALQMGELPDIDALIDKELSDDDGFGGGRRGRIGRKSPKIKPAQLLGMKKGM